MLNFKFDPQTTDMIGGISAPAAAFLEAFFQRPPGRRSSTSAMLSVRQDADALSPRNRVELSAAPAPCSGRITREFRGRCAPRQFGRPPIERRTRPPDAPAPQGSSWAIGSGLATKKPWA